MVGTRCYPLCDAPRLLRKAACMSLPSLLLTGCLGWGDIFAPKHRVSGDYSLMQGESGSTDEVYLLMKGESVSVAGPLLQVGWNQRYIIFTDQNWPAPWSVLEVSSHRKFNITEAQRGREKAYQDIRILFPAQAWTEKGR